jgi:hypothetical protein
MKKVTKLENMMNVEKFLKVYSNKGIQLLPLNEELPEANDIDVYAIKEVSGILTQDGRVVEVAY